MKKVLVFGVFDFFHIGHLRLFQQAKKFGDYLIVAVQDEESARYYKPDTKFFYSTDERVELIKSLKVVDEVVVYQHVVTSIEQIHFDVLCLGEDHVGDRFDRIIDWCKNNNKEVHRLKYTVGISSTILKKEYGRFEVNKEHNC